MTRFPRAFALLLCVSLLCSVVACGTGEETAPQSAQPVNLTKTTPDNDNTPTFAWDAPSEASGISGYVFRIQDESWYEYWTFIGDSTATTCETAISDGNHAFEVAAVDQASNLVGVAILDFTVDATAPVITGVTVSGITESGVTVSWATSEPATSQVEYGATTAYGSSSVLDSPLVANHAVNLSGLRSGTTYNYRVRSKDSCANEQVSGDQTLATSSAVPPCQLTVHFIDVGQGDAILLDTGDQEVLIDGGDGGSELAAYLNTYVDGPLEAIMATHMDADHIGGLAAVLNAFQVQQVWHNGSPGSTVTYAAFWTAVGRESADLHVARRGDTITVGRMALSVLNPAEIGESSNNNSIVLSLAWGQVDFLFEGDAEQEAEQSMVAAAFMHDVDVLKVGHHGSRTASSSAFLAEVKPEVAIYMAGAGNDYGHPHAETIEALGGVGATIYGTDLHGTITVSTDGATYQTATEKQAPPVTPPTGDTTGPVISGVTVSNTTCASAIVTWTTDEASTSQVEYGRAASYGSSTTIDSSLVTTHSVSLSGLDSGTTYHFRVKCKDAAANESTSQDSTFTTSTAGSAIQIGRVFYDGAVPTVESDEYVEITNLGDAAQDMKGWVLKDVSDGSPSLTFPSYVLHPGESIRVYTDEMHPEWGGFSFQSGIAVWNNKNPDTAALFDAQGNEVSRKTY